MGEMTENLIYGNVDKNETEKLRAHHFLLQYLYTGDLAVLEKYQETFQKYGWDKWHCAVLLETGLDFFDKVSRGFSEEIFSELRRNFYYINLNERQSLLLFSDVNCDYQLIAKQICMILRRRYTERFYLSISKRFDGLDNISEILGMLEQRMEEKYYYKEDRVFFSEEDELNSVGKEVQDAQIMQLISEDISRKDAQRLWKHFGYLKEKYQDNTSFSAMYVKFVFSNVVQEIFQENYFSEEGRLEKEIDLLYACNSISQILMLTENIIREYEEFLKNSIKESGEELIRAKKYIEENCDKDFTIEMLEEECRVASGYLCFVFRKENGISIIGYRHVCRMHKAKDLLILPQADWKTVGRSVGYGNLEYFYRSFFEYYGFAPDRCNV